MRAPGLTILRSADGMSDPSAALPYQPDATARRARTLGRLKGLTAKPPGSMPPALEDREVVLQPPGAVLRRAGAPLRRREALTPREPSQIEAAAPE